VRRGNPPQTRRVSQSPFIFQFDDCFRWKIARHIFVFERGFAANMMAIEGRTNRLDDAFSCLGMARWALQLSAKRTKLYDCRHGPATLPLRRRVLHVTDARALRPPTGTNRPRWPPVRPNWSPLLHFPQIIWLAMKSSKPREWTELEVKTLISMSGQLHSAAEISKSLGRHVGSVKTKARELGLVAVNKRSKSRRWGAN
jgi:hypothetical protein